MRISAPFGGRGSPDKGAEGDVQKLQDLPMVGNSAHGVTGKPMTSPPQAAGAPSTALAADGLLSTLLIPDTEELSKVCVYLGGLGRPGVIRTLLRRLSLPDWVSGQPEQWELHCCPSCSCCTCLELPGLFPKRPPSPSFRLACSALCLSIHSQSSRTPVTGPLARLLLETQRRPQVGRHQGRQTWFPHSPLGWPLALASLLICAHSCNSSYCKLLSEKD